MGVTALFKCDGCDARAEAAMHARFISLSGRDYGFGRVVEDKASDVVPDGWQAFDPYTKATYCPSCWKEIIDD